MIKLLSSKKIRVRVAKFKDIPQFEKQNLELNVRF